VKGRVTKDKDGDDIVEEDNDHDVDMMNSSIAELR